MVIKPLDTDEKRIISLEEALERTKNYDPQKNLSNGETKKLRTEPSIPKSKIYRFVVLTCLVLGIICVLSSIFKTWFSKPNPFDWFLLSMGVVLCGLSLFKEFSVTMKGVEARMKEMSEIMLLMMKPR